MFSVLCDKKIKEKQIWKILYQLWKMLTFIMKQLIQICKKHSKSLGEE